VVGSAACLVAQFGRPGHLPTGSIWGVKALVVLVPQEGLEAPNTPHHKHLKCHDRFVNHT